MKLIKALLVELGVLSNSVDSIVADIHKKLTLMHEKHKELEQKASEAYDEYKQYSKDADRAEIIKGKLADLLGLEVPT